MPYATTLVTEASRENLLRIPRAPIVFASPGLDIDVRIVVFDEEYHVHSTILKLNSAWFRTSIGRIDRGTPKIPVSEFKYDYVSVLDKDGIWGLEIAAEADAQATKPQYEISQNDQETERTGFRKLLCAFYQQPLLIDIYRGEVEEVRALVRLGDYYCALPVLSRSFIDLHLHEDISWAMENYPMAFLLAAKKLRLPWLFREALVYFVADVKYARGVSGTPVNKEVIDTFDGDKTLKYAVMKADNLVKTKQALVDQQFLLATASMQGHSPEKEMADRLSSASRTAAARIIVTNGTVDPAMKAWYYRYMKEELDRLGEEIGQQFLPKGLYSALDVVLQNNLRLFSGCRRITGLSRSTHVTTEIPRLNVRSGPPNSMLLCASIADGDFPWDDSSDW